MEICFVHLGSNAPEHLWLNIARMNLLFPGTKLTLIGNSKETRRVATSKGVTYLDHVSSPSEEVFLDSLSTQHDLRFRNGFWKYSLQRVFAAAKFAEESAAGILHIESDILVMPDFPFDEFEKSLDRVSWQKFNESHDVASLLWFPDNFSTKTFLEKLIKVDFPSSNSTDMTVLCQLAKQFPESFGVIPSAGDRGQLNYDVEMHDTRIVDISKFKGYFDAAAFGMWVFGQDPRNHYGFSLRYQDLPHSKVDPSNTLFSLTDAGTCIDSYGNRVFSFHVHSKDKKLFLPENQKRLRFYFESSYKRKRRRIYDRSARKELFADYRERRMLLHLLYNIPIVKQAVSTLPFRSQIRKILNIK